MHSLKGQAARRLVDEARGVRPATHNHLWNWVRHFTGVKIPRAAVCAGHTALFDLFARQFFERPSLALWHGPRGSGKSFLSAIETHLTSRFHPRHGTRILGGSLAQSEQIYEALKDAIHEGRTEWGSDADSLARLLKTEAHYKNGSQVSILAASRTSVRGPHVASLKLDEVDEIEPEIREAAIGMAMEKRGCRASVLMTSTWHRVGGPMAELMDRGRSGAFPVDTFCIFEALERCPPERSGLHYEKCPECPIVTWCHSDRDTHPQGLPKAKRCDGHYAIDSLIQKVKGVSKRVFESDFLCLRPRAGGAWFTMFDESRHVSLGAEYDPSRPVHLAIDPGVHTGAVWFQTRPRLDGNGHKVSVFADYFAEGLSAEANARAIQERTCTLAGSAIARLRVSIDPAGGARTAVGPTVRGEFERTGVIGQRGLESWPVAKKADGLHLIEALLSSADGSVSLKIHPRCRHLAIALASYARAKRGGQWMDYAEDPQHPHEDLVDPLAGGLKLEFPQGRTPAPALRTIHAAAL
jgi:hypothetical protein